MSRQAFKSWTPETFEETGQTPQDAIREVELDALVEKCANDWMLKLFFPLGLRDMLEGQVQSLMHYQHQPYDAVMGMPSSRRRRLHEKLTEMYKRR